LGKRVGKLIGVVQTLRQLPVEKVSPSENLEIRSEADLALLVEAL
jgi:hypothetical protein